MRSSARSDRARMTSSADSDRARMTSSPDSDRARMTSSPDSDRARMTSSADFDRTTMTSAANSDGTAMTSSVDRRDFLKSASATGLGVMMTNRLPASLLGRSASEKVVVAVIGVNGRGQVHAQNFARGKNTEVAYVCDVDSTVLSKVVKQTQDAQSRAPKAIDDFR